MDCFRTSLQTCCRILNSWMLNYQLEWLPMHLTRQCSILNKIHNCFNINPITCCEQFLSEKHLNLCEILIPLRRFKASVMKWGKILPNKKRKISSTDQQWQCFVFLIIMEIHFMIFLKMRMFSWTVPWRVKWDFFGGF